MDPERIKRIRGDLPPGYEVADVTGPAALSGFWGFRAGWTAEPPQCAALVDPISAPAETQVARGLSGSGAGGIVYVVVVTPPPGTLAPDPALTADCGQFTMAYQRSTASVNLVDAPTVDAAATVGMAAEISTVVESGSETDSRAQSFTAYVAGSNGDHFVFVTLVTDPGSPNPPLSPDFAAGLLVKTVAALRR
ncbi:DUF5642 family protein [soil metagenome]